MPESPKWLLSKGRKDDAIRVLKMVKKRSYNNNDDYNNIDYDNDYDSNNNNNGYVYVCVYAYEYI